MDLDANTKLELVTKHLECFSLELGPHCAGLRLATLHLSSPSQEADSRELLDLVLEELCGLHRSLEEELSTLFGT